MNKVENKCSFTVQFEMNSKSELVALLSISGTITEKTIQNLNTKCDLLLHEDYENFVFDLKRLNSISKDGEKQLLCIVNNIRVKGGKIEFLNKPDKLKSYINI